MTSTLEIAWLAGLLEGEGCFYYRIRAVKAARGGYRYKESCLITVSSTDADVIAQISIMWKSSIRVIKHSPYKDYYTTVINGANAISWMMTIFPLMNRRRKDKIKEIISSWRSR